MQVVVKDYSVYHKDIEAPLYGVDDMAKLAYLHEPDVLENLRSRYHINEIYVCILDATFPDLYLNVFILDPSSYQNFITDLHWEYIDCYESFHKALSFIS